VEAVERTPELSAFMAVRGAGASARAPRPPCGVASGSAAVSAAAGATGPPVPPAGWLVEPTAPDRSPAAFSALYLHEYVGLVRLAYLILGSRELAEEVVQDAFVRLHGRWRRVDNPGGYLRTSVVNGCRDVRRRLVRYRAREPRLAVRAETYDAPDELSDALAALPVRQRAVLVLRFYGGMSEAEIATTLGIRPGTVKSSLHRGLERLRRELAP
jgi:RNA polymerase sigma-70 factor (sigma-E family)